MNRFTTFLALVVSGMEAVQPAAAAGVLAAGLTARMRLGVYPFQRRQGIPPVPTCDSLCNPISCGTFRIARPLNVARSLSRTDISTVSCALPL